MKTDRNPLVSKEYTEWEGNRAYGVEFKGNETVVTIVTDGIVGVGSSKCNPIDVYSRDIGEGIASARAYKNLAGYVEEVWINRAITKEEYQKKHPKKKM